MDKELITLSKESVKTQCYEFECFEDNYALTISTQGCPINKRKIDTKKHSLYTALKHSIRQHKLDLNLRARLCKILISSFAHKMDFAHNFSVDFF